MAVSPTVEVVIYRTAPGPRTEVGRVAAGVEQLDVSGLTDETAYTFVAVALDAQDRNSPDSAPASATTPAAPSAVVADRETVGDTTS